MPCGSASTTSPLRSASRAGSTIPTSNRPPAASWTRAGSMGRPPCWARGDVETLRRGPAEGFQMLVYLADVWIYQQALKQGLAAVRLEQRFQKYYKVPSIVVTPIRVNTKLDDLRAAIGGRSGFGPQVRPGKVMPDGGVALPAVGTVPAQGLTVAEFKQELDARYQEVIEGVEVTPLLMQRAARYVYVLGEVRTPGRYPLEAPTTVMQAIALAGSWNFGANVNQVVIFRRADDWRLIATVVSLRPALLGREPCPAGEIWVSDSDLIILPKNKFQLCDNWIELIFTKGLYGMFPVSGSVSFTNLSYLSPTTP